MSPWVKAADAVLEIAITEVIGSCDKSEVPPCASEFHGTKESA